MKTNDREKRKEQKLRDDLYWHRKIVAEYRKHGSGKNAKTLDQILYKINFPGARGLPYDREYAHQRALDIIKDRVYLDDEYNIISWFHSEAKGRRLYDIADDINAFNSKFDAVTKTAKSWKYKVYAAWRRHMLKLAAKLSKSEAEEIRQRVREADQTVGW